MNKALKAIFFIFFLPILSVHAHKPYQAEIEVAPASSHVSATNLVDLSHELKTSAIQELIPFYTPVSPVTIDINLRGILANAAFPAGSSTLVVSLPQAGTTVEFMGATRNESILLFKDYVRDGGTKHNLLQAYARYSPIDPIAGNPNSLLSRMGLSDYLIGHLSPLSGCDCEWSAQPIVHQFQLGANSGWAFCKGFNTTSITMPTRYSYSPDLDWALILDAPLTFNDNGGAYSLFGSLGLGLRVPVTYNWSLTPVVRYGAGGSLDLCTAGSFLSAGITSVFNYQLWDWVFSLTDFAGYYTSTNLWLSGVNFNYHLHNYIFNNGVSLTSCNGICLLGRPLRMSVSFMDSAITRRHLFMKHYDEVGVSLIATEINPCIDYDCLIVGFRYQFGQKQYKGFFVDLDYQF